jgi:hypothetical protein
MSGYGASQDASNLRLPVPFFDLLMVLLVTCLVFVAPIRPEGEPVQAMDVAIAHGGKQASPDQLIAIVPHRVGPGWAYESEGKPIAAAELARRATAEGKKVVLVVPSATALQDFVDMQTAIAALHVPFALAIRSKESP